VFVVRAGIPQMLMAEVWKITTQKLSPQRCFMKQFCFRLQGGPEKAEPLVSRLILLVRQALRSNDGETFSSGLAALW